MKNKIRLVLCGGGTAGHVSPAIAIADIVKNSYKNAEIIFIGRKGGYENEPILRSGYKLYELDVCGLKRKISYHNVKAVIKLFKAIKESKAILRDSKPDLIIGTGGYVCFAPLLAGKALKIKTAIHESNAYPGLVTKLLAGRVDVTMLGFKEAKSFIKYKEKCKVTGNPIRAGFDSMTRKKAKKILGLKDSDKLIISFGGSLGSESMNSCIIELMKSYSATTKNLYHVHATGKKSSINTEYNRTSEFKENKNARVLEYIEDMPLYMKAADLAITRSGAMTLSELLYANLPAILIPSPNVADNHQYKNAIKMQESGYAILIEEKDLTSERLRNEINKLIFNGNALDLMRLKIASADKSSPSVDILETISNLVDLC